MQRLIFFLGMSLSLLILNTKSIAQTDTISEDFCISSEEYQLYQLINDYRKTFALAPIDLSKSLSFVAKKHVHDLAVNYNPDSICNMHSWSDKGRWASICFPSEQSKKNNVWLKAKEIIGYPSEANEITFWSNVESSPRQILNFWRENKESNDLLINQLDWEKKSWNAIGIGIENGYAVVWLGESVDFEVSTSVCGSSVKILNEASPIYRATNSGKSSIKTPLYYIIIGSYKDRKDAVNAVRSYKEMGYPKAILVESDKKIRVAIDYLADKKEADQSLKKFAKKFRGAWVLTI